MSGYDLSSLCKERVEEIQSQGLSLESADTVSRGVTVVSYLVSQPLGSIQKPLSGRGYMEGTVPGVGDSKKDKMRFLQVRSPPSGGRYSYS